MSRLEQFYGSMDVDGLFHGGQQTVAPWEQASRSKVRKDYDPALVHTALTKVTRPEDLHLVDPRTLRATQRSVTRPGVEYYLGRQWEQTGETFADKTNPGNKFPVVYQRDDGQSLLLSGHHRAAAALLRGQPLRARTVEGPWGPKR